MRFSELHKKLLLILLLALALRLIAANNLALTADDSVYSTYAINFLESGKLSTTIQSPIYFYLTDIFYRLLGVTAISARFASVLFGVLSIVLVFLVCKHLKNEELAFYAAFFLAVSPFAIRTTIGEMDWMAAFFVVSSVYVYLTAKTRKSTVFSALLFGIGLLTKFTVVLFLPALLIYEFLKAREKNQSASLFITENKEKLAIFIAVILICLLPLFIYNYFLYSFNGAVDIVFLRMLGRTHPMYTSFFGMEGFDIARLVANIFAFSIELVSKDPPLLLAVAGFAISEKSYKFLAVFILLPMIFLLGISLTEVHYTIILPFAALLAAPAIEFSIKKLSVSSRDFLILLLLISCVFLWSVFTVRSAELQLREFAVSSVPENSVVLLDEKIYRGYAAWALNDKHYFEMKFTQIIFERGENESKKLFNAYFIECLRESCGWKIGEFVPMDTAPIKQNSEKIFEIKEGSEPVYSIYHTKFALPSNAIETMDGLHFLLLYPVGWEKENIEIIKQRVANVTDFYEVSGTPETLLNLLGYFVLYSLLLLTLLSPLYFIKIAFAEVKEPTTSPPNTETLVVESLRNDEPKSP